MNEVMHNGMDIIKEHFQVEDTDTLSKEQIESYRKWFN